MKKGFKLTPPTPEQKKKIDKLLSNIRSGKVKFEMAPVDRIDHLWPYVKIVLKALGHPEAMVTDESTVDHFIVGSDSEMAIELKKLAIKLRLDRVSLSDKIFELAERIRKRKGK